MLKSGREVLTPIISLLLILIAVMCLVAMFFPVGNFRISAMCGKCHSNPLIKKNNYSRISTQQLLNRGAFAQATGTRQQTPGNTLICPNCQYIAKLSRIGPCPKCGVKMCQILK